MRRALVVAVLVLAGCSATTAPGTAKSSAIGDQAGWERNDLDAGLFPAGAKVNSMVVLGSRLVAVGGDGSGAAAWWSTDGRQWLRARGLGGGPGLALVAARPGLAYAVAVDDRGQNKSAGWVTQDGMSWTAAGSPLGDTKGGYVGTLFSFQGRFLATGAVSSSSGPSMWSSADGQSWKPAPVGEGADFSLMGGVAVTSHAAVLVGHASEFGGPAVVRSPDGTRWTPAAISSAPAGSSASETEAVTEFRGRLVAVGRASLGDTPRLAVWTSADGAAWTEQPDGPLLVSQSTIRYLSATATGVAALAAGVTLAPAPPILLLSTDGTTFNPVALAHPTFAEHPQLTATASFRGALWVIGRDDRGAAIWRWPGAPSPARRYAVTVSANPINTSTPAPFRIQPSAVGTLTPGQRALLTLTFTPTGAQPYVLRFTGTTWTTTATVAAGAPGQLGIAGTMCDAGTCQPSPLHLFVGLASPADCHCNYGGENLPVPPWIVLATDNIAPGTYHTDAPVQWSTLQNRFTFNPTGHGDIRLTIDIRDA